MNLPNEYKWLAKEPAPRMLIQGLTLFGVTEKPGKGSNPIIMSWAHELKAPDWYIDDDTPWCGLFAAIVAKRSGKTTPKDYLGALNWARWGTECIPALGCVMVFRRQGAGKGHVGIYVGEDATHYHVLGGNQGNQVSIVRVAKSRFVAARDQYKTARPRNVRPRFLKDTGRVSTNEA